MRLSFTIWACLLNMPEQTCIVVQITSMRNPYALPKQIASWELGIAPSLVTYLSLLNPIPLIYLSGAFIIAQILSKKALHLSWLGWQGKSISHYVLKTWICNWVHDVKAACHLAPLANFEPQWFVHLALHWFLVFIYAHYPHIKSIY